MRRLFRPLLILLALVFLFEAWLWSHLAPVVAWVVRPHPAARHQSAAQGLDRSPDACRHPHRLHRARIAAAPAQVSGAVDAGARLLAGRARRACIREDAKRWGHGVHLRRDAAQTHADGLVPMALRPRDGRLGLGARIDRSDQAPTQDLLSNVGAAACGTHIATARTHPAADAGGMTAVRSGGASAEGRD